MTIISGALIGIVVTLIGSYLLGMSEDTGSDPSGTSSSSGSVNYDNAPSAVARWKRTIRDVADGIDYPLPTAALAATIWQESAGDPNAQGADGEIGLTQVREIAVQDVRENFPDLARQYNVEWPPSGPTAQIAAGALYHKLQHERVGGGLRRTLRAYNEGPPPLRTRASRIYADEVIEKMQKLG